MSLSEKPLNSVITMFLKWLGFDPEKHSVRTEILAGLTTFLTMAYILAVNPNVFDALGGEREFFYTSYLLG